MGPGEKNEGEKRERGEREGERGRVRRRERDGEKIVFMYHKVL